MTFFDWTADLVGQLNGNGQKGMLQIDARTPCQKFLATPLLLTSVELTLNKYRLTNNNKLLQCRQRKDASLLPSTE